MAVPDQWLEIVRKVEQFHASPRPARDGAPLQDQVTAKERRRREADQGEARGRR